VKELFAEALERETSERPALLDQACAGDEALRREVELLLSGHEKAGSFIEAPALEVATQAMAQERDRPVVGRQLSAYQILSRLGAGGMGVVYRARDTKLDRTVAIKMLPPAVASDREWMHRFVREAKSAAALNHPNVATIYEIGEADGLHFIAMEYVEGETLQARIGGQRLELAETIEIGLQVSDALDEAHTKGVTHRDIKPANIMITPRGRVKVLDFGLAKITRAEGQIADSQASLASMTAPGVVMGTLPYMSPEQLLGREVDHRTDIFSLGVVLYEMATGRLPFAGASANATMDRILHAQPEAISHINGQAPVELERIVLKCLAKEREQRYQSAREVMADLSRLKEGSAAGAVAAGVESASKPRARFTARRLVALAAAVMVVVAAMVYALLFRGASGERLPEIKSLAVLPLENLSGDPAQEYFADGMTESLISNLTQVRALRVISRTSVMRFKGSRKPLAEIARELNVDAVIEGSVRRDGGRVKITARLIQAVNDTPLRSFDYERELADVLKLQSEVARAVADEIRIQMTVQERARLASARSVNPQAHEAYLLGRVHFSKNNEQDWKQAIEYFERATHIAPDYAAAYTGLSDAWLQRGIFAVKPFKEVEPPARAAALRAVGLDEQLAEAHISLANLKHYYDWDWAGAEAAFRRALELDPGSLQAHLHYGHLLMHLGRHDEAVREGQIAVQLDPLTSETQTALGRFLYRARRYEEALPYLKRAVELEPRSVGANVRLGGVYVQQRRYDQAIAVFEKGRELTGDGRTFQAVTAHVYALTGKQREARQMISGVKAAPILVAAVYTALGDKDEAFRILEKAIEERNSLLAPLKEDPPLENLHSDPRWKDLLRRMNFPPK
jgi:serine/threonine-protein kinase